MKLDGSNVADWTVTARLPGGRVRIDSPTLATVAAADQPAAHVSDAWGGLTLREQFPWTRPHNFAATDAHGRSPEAARGGGEPVDHPPVWAPASASTAETWNLPPTIQVSPGARATDPATSRLAAAAVSDDVRRQVLAILAEGPASDFDLAARTGLKQTSVGCRRKELRDMGYVTELDHGGVSGTGSACIRWVLTSAGWAAA